jgi:8-oxo-dGTP pyrophosphatase MutT (NUDIX family)
MAPEPRPGWQPARSPLQARDAAGLILLFPIEERVHLLLTVRSSRLPSHAGQVSLPGGAVEAGESIEQAALREAWEETGVDPARVRLIGRLTPLHIPVSGFVLHPMAGVTDARPSYRLAPGEVERIVEPPLDALLDPACVKHRAGTWDGVSHDVPFFSLDGAVVWGATAMILAELIAVVGPGEPSARFPTARSPVA